MAFGNKGGGKSKSKTSYNIERYQRGVDRFLTGTDDVASGASEIADRGKRKLSRKVRSQSCLRLS
jgi:hypothetical protein